MKKTSKKTAAKTARKNTAKRATKKSAEVIETSVPVAEVAAETEQAPKAKRGLDYSDATKAGVARKAIEAGLSNAEVLEALKAAFPEGDWEKHSYYPAWYRAQLVMKGAITKEWAAEHSADKRQTA